MFGKGSKLYSIGRIKCPHCHEGEFLLTRNLYDLSHAGDLRDGCPVCHRKFSPEPGFYYGGMFVSYALAVALCAAIYVAVGVVAPNSGATTHIGWVLGGLLVLSPVLYALSKVIWANLFIHYKGVEPTADEDPKWRMP